MILLLSPAKTLDYESPLPAGVQRKSTRPFFTDQAAELISWLRPLSARKLAALMELSPNLAELNTQRYQAWSTRATAANSRPAVLAFNGDVYDGLQAASLSAQDLDWAQEHVVILSGLYGALRPLDRLQPYRLEMGTPLGNPRGRDLYAYWGDAVAHYLEQRLAQEKGRPRAEPPLLVNLASQEYFKVADRKALQARVVDCAFEDHKGGQYKVISFFAKRARGLMARHAILKRAESLDALKSFDADGYRFAPEASSPDRLVFRRRSI